MVTDAIGDNKKGALEPTKLISLGMKDDHKNSPMAVIYLGVIDEVVYEVVNTEVQEQHIEQGVYSKRKTDTGESS